MGYVVTLVELGGGILLIIGLSLLKKSESSS
jgi:hypothetical protein